MSGLPFDALSAKMSSQVLTMASGVMNGQLEIITGCDVRAVYHATPAKTSFFLPFIKRPKKVYLPGPASRLL